MHTPTGTPFGADWCRENRAGEWSPSRRVALAHPHGMSHKGNIAMRFGHPSQGYSHGFDSGMRDTGLHGTEHIPVRTSTAHSRHSHCHFWRGLRHPEGQGGSSPELADFPTRKGHLPIPGVAVLRSPSPDGGRMARTRAKNEPFIHEKAPFLGDRWDDGLKQGWWPGGRVGGPVIRLPAFRKVLARRTPFDAGATFPMPGAWIPTAHTMAPCNRIGLRHRDRRRGLAGSGQQPVVQPNQTAPRGVGLVKVGSGPEARRRLLEASPSFYHDRNRNPANLSPFVDSRGSCNVVTVSQ
jgi:hypothetical protein